MSVGEPVILAPVLLVGSLPLNNAEEVFRAASAELGTYVIRLPDGETGTRTKWIAWQREVFAALPQLETTPGRERDYQLFPPFRLKADTSIDDVSFGPLGFLRETAQSYGKFRQLKASGIVPAAMQFQLCLPTPFAPAYSFVAYQSQNDVYPRYEAAMLAELGEITKVIPPDELSVQWDVATEMSIWEELYPVTFDDPRSEIIRRLARLGEAVPAGAELGYHLCYGSMNNKHWKEPADTRKLVEVANLLSARIDRPIDWLHLPVPIDRDDDAYFAPLRELSSSETTLYLGLLHLQDGVAGATRRAKAARRYTSDFGIAAECELGRWNADAVPIWLELHRYAADALQ